MTLHNKIQYRFISKNKDTKFESNSQQFPDGALPDDGLYQRTKIQNLKAIHNSATDIVSFGLFISKNKDTKFESNSQPGWM